MDLIYDYLIIGAGAAGLSASCLLNQRKYKTMTLEAHSLPGGSASYFYRSRYCFDVGATTFSGLKENGPLRNFLSEINLDLPFIKIDPGIIVKIDQKTIKHFSNPESYLKELVAAFPEIEISTLQKFITSNHQFDQLGYEAIAHNFLPKRSLLSLHQFLTLSNFKYLPLINILNKSYLEILPAELKNNDHFLKMINEMLLITAQNNAERTPALMGILGVNYPSDTNYLMGGMKSFSDALKTKSGTIKTNEKVVKIVKKGNYFEVYTEKNTFKAINIISSLPQINNQLLLGQKPKIDAETWSAFTLYFTVPKSLKLESLYYQIHTPTILELGTKSIFCSFSHPEDNNRNIENRRTVTISTHAMPAIFNNLTAEEYLHLKNNIAEFILNLFLNHFDLDRNQIDHLEIGTPKTFAKYTNRFNGSVGGIGHDISQKLSSMVYSNNLEKNFYSIGDTTFPGQGIAAVIYGANSLINNLES